jgi:hypothetical protein
MVDADLKNARPRIRRTLELQNPDPCATKPPKNGERDRWRFPRRR